MVHNKFILTKTLVTQVFIVTRLLAQYSSPQDVQLPCYQSTQPSIFIQKYVLLFCLIYEHKVNMDMADQNEKFSKTTLVASAES